MKPATLVTATGRRASSQTQSAALRGGELSGRNASHHPTRVVAHPSATNFEGERPGGQRRENRKPFPGAYLNSEISHHRRRGHAMSSLLVACVSIGTPLVAVGLHDLQAWLERWDYDRHAQD